MELKQILHRNFILMEKFVVKWATVELYCGIVVDKLQYDRWAVSWYQTLIVNYVATFMQLLLSVGQWMSDQV